MRTSVRDKRKNKHTGKDDWKMIVNPPYLGVAYYPEDWPDEEMDKDIAKMKEIVNRWLNMRFLRLIW